MRTSWKKKLPDAEIHRWTLMSQQTVQRAIEIFFGFEVEFLGFKTTVTEQKRVKSAEVWGISASGTVKAELLGKNGKAGEPHSLSMELEIYREEHQEWRLSTDNCLRLFLRDYTDKSWFGFDLELSYDSDRRTPLLEIRNHLTDSNCKDIDARWRTGHSLGDRKIISNLGYQPHGNSRYLL